ncbi:hypothetical protein ACHAXT_003073 [Thalassiosira profunda]
MGLRHLAAFLPLVAPFVQAKGPARKRSNAARYQSKVRADEAYDPYLGLEAKQPPRRDLQEEMSVATTTGTGPTEPEDTGTPPNYTEEQCNYWLDLIVASDASGTGGLNEGEYHAFLSSIADPPYIAEYFTAYEGFDELPWIFRVVHKSLSCHCEKLGYGAECCEGDNAEVLTVGMEDRDLGTTPAEEEYHDLVCQQISYVLDRTIESPQPTKAPTPPPTGAPSAMPVTQAPVTAAPVVTPAPTVSVAPTAGDVIPPLEKELPEEDSGLSTGAIVGIVLALLALLLAIIALILYRRHLERQRLRAFAGDQMDEDLESPEAADEGEAPLPEPEANDEPQPEPEPEADDESSAPSVWSGSEAEETGEMGMVDADDQAVGVTAGSSLAAMGAAGAAAANLSGTGGAMT